MEKKLLQEMRFMMERLESPRMTDTEYQKRRKTINETMDMVTLPVDPIKGLGDVLSDIKNSLKGNRNVEEMGAELAKDPKFKEAIQKDFEKDPEGFTKKLQELVGLYKQEMKNPKPVSELSEAWSFWDTNPSGDEYRYKEGSKYGQDKQISWWDWFKDKLTGFSIGAFIGGTGASIMVGMTKAIGQASTGDVIGAIILGAIIVGTLVVASGASDTEIRRD